MRHLFSLLISTFLIQFAHPILATQTLEVTESKTLGQGMVTDVAYSPAGDTIAIASSIGVWFYDSTSHDLNRFIGFSEWVNAIDWSPDGAYLALGSDTLLAIYDPQTGDELLVWEHEAQRLSNLEWSPEGQVLLSNNGLWDALTGKRLEAPSFPGGLGLEWSPDGSRIASLTWRSLPTIYDAFTREELVQYKGFATEQTSFGMSDDWKYMAVGGLETALDVLDLETGQMTELDGHVWDVRSIDFSPDSSKLATGARTIKVWDTASWELLLELDGGSRQVTGIDWSPNGQHLLTASRSGVVNLWDATTGDIIHEFNEFTSQFYSVAWSEDGQRLAAETWGNNIVVWDVADAKQNRVFPAIASSFNDYLNSDIGFAWSPDERHFVTGTPDGDVYIRNWTNGKLVRVLEGHTELIKSLVWSPGGDFIASGAEDSTARIWDAKTGLELSSLRAHPEKQEKKLRSVGSIDWAPDGSKLLIGERGRQLYIWDLETFQEVGIFDAHEEAVDSAFWSPDGTKVASIDGYNGGRTIRIWDAASQIVLQHIQLENYRHFTQISWSPDSHFLASGDWSGDIHIWEVDSGQIVDTFLFQASYLPSKVVTISWSPNGELLAFSKNDGSMGIWDIEQDTHKIMSHEQYKDILQMAWSPNSTQLATAAPEESIRIWDVVTGKEVRSLIIGSEKGNNVAWSPDGKWLASAGRDNQVYIWDTASWKQEFLIWQPESWVNALTWSPDSLRLAAGGTQGKVRIWDLSDGVSLDGIIQTHSLYTPPLAVNSVSWSPDGSMLATIASGYFKNYGVGINDFNVWVWNAKSGKLLAVLKGHTDEIEDIAWSPNGDQLAASGWDGTLRVWDIQSHEQLLVLEGHQGRLGAQNSSKYVWGVAWSPDGNLIASAGTDSTIRIWDANTGQELLIIDNHTAGVNDVAWSPDGTWLASAGWDGTIRLWQIK